jgi:hypothetical protein
MKNHVEYFKDFFALDNEQLVNCNIPFESHLEILNNPVIILYLN